MKKLSTILLTLALMLTLVSPAAAASSPALLMEGSGKVRLTLQNLGGREVNSVQLELTLSGDYSQVSFTASNATSGSYSRCKAETAGDQTRITIYVDSLRTLNQSGTVSLGTLTLGSGYSAPGSARLTILDRGLEPADSGRTIPVRSAAGTGTGGGGASVYAVRAVSTGRGRVSVSPERAERGETVTITTRPESGCQLSELSATSGGRRLQLNDQGSGKFTFTMPGADVEVWAAFTAVSPAALPFADVKEGVWFHDAVEYAYENGLMSGTSATTFGPDLPTSRGMIVTILYRLAGAPASGPSSFTDVADGQYYAKAVSWAATNGVVSGYGNGRFGPNDPITREQMAVILRGYARLNGKDVSAQADLSGYQDEKDISAYALESMRWASAKGLINGTSAVTLTPAGTATRAQAAVIFRGFCETVMSDS